MAFRPALVSLLGSGAFLLLLAFWGLRGVSDWTANGWLPVYVRERFNLSQGAAGFVATGYGVIPSMLGFLIGGAWADRWSRSNPSAPIRVAAIGALASVPAFLLTFNTGVLPIAIAGIILYSLVKSFADPNVMPIVCLVADRRYRATGYGVLNMLGTVVGGLAIYLAGLLRDAHVSLVTTFRGAAATLLVCAICLALIRTARPGGQAQGLDDHIM